MVSTIPQMQEATANPIVDEDRVQRLRDAIGVAEVERLTRDLHTRIGSAFPSGATRLAIAHEAHALIAMAGSLGFSRLSVACRDLEAAASGGTDVTGAIRQVQEAIRSSLNSRHDVGLKT